MKKILLVDDDPLVMNFVSSLLSDAGYKVLCAPNGEEAIRISKYETGEIDLLLSDLEMPGISGIELATCLCLERPALRVLLMSGFNGGMLVLNEGWHFLAKPFVQSQLKALILNILGDAPNFNALVKTKI